MIFKLKRSNVNDVQLFLYDVRQKRSKNFLHRKHKKSKTK